MKALDVAYCIGEQHSLHLVRDNAGSLIALSAPLCRSGWQTYRAEELGVGGDEMVNVYRPKDEVLSSAHIASIEGKAVTLNHPSEFLNPQNHGYHAKGHVQNVRRGDDVDGEVQVIGDVHVTDEQAIERIAQGVRDLSLGYYYEIHDGPRAGTYTQRNLRCNHVAIVPRGRAGTAKIIDRAFTHVETVAQFLGRKFEGTVQRFHRKNAKDVLPHSDNEESPLLEHLNSTIQGEETEEPMNNQQVLDAIAAGNAALKQLFDDFKASMNKPKAKDGECTCGGKKSHSDSCPMYAERGEDMDENFGERNHNPAAAPDLIPVGGGSNGNYNLTAADYQTALNNMRSIRHIVADSGDRKAIVAFNAAVTDIKHKLADALMRPERVGPDPQRQGTDVEERVRAEGADYEATCKNLHRRDIPNIGVDTTEFIASSKKRKAADATEPQDFETQVRRARDKKLKG